MRVLLGRVAAGLCLVPLVAGTAAAGSMFRERPDWNVGISCGFGPARIEGFEVIARDKSIGAAPHVRVGRMLGSKTMLSVNWESWLVEYGDPPAKMHRGLQTLGLGVGFFPGRATSAWGGLYVRGGMGFASSVIGAKEALPDTPQGLGVARIEHGVGYFGELGYEIRLPRNFAAGLKTAANHFDIGDLFLDRATVVAAVVDLSLYF